LRGELLWMIMPFPNLAVISFVLGIVYGLLHPGKENRFGMIKRAIGLGVLLGILFGLLFAIFLPGFLGVLFLGVSILSFVMFVLLIALPFVIGTIVGDIIEALI